jgi:hypothetical protein
MIVNDDKQDLPAFSESLGSQSVKLIGPLLVEKEIGGSWVFAAPHGCISSRAHSVKGWSRPEI